MMLQRRAAKTFNLPAGLRRRPNGVQQMNVAARGLAAKDAVADKKNPAARRFRHGLGVGQFGHAFLRFESLLHL